MDNGETVSTVVAFITPASADYFAYGMTSVDGGKPVDEGTVYETGSITKAFTGVLLAEMGARGEV